MGKGSDYYDTTIKRNGVSIFDIWETGEAVGDSITPATHVPAYRELITDEITSGLPVPATIFSGGCGNGFVERDLAARGFNVSGIDINENAVRLARNKNLDVCLGDFFEITDREANGVDCYYFDGFLGHIFNEEDRLRVFFGKLASLAKNERKKVVISNDAPTTSGLEFQKHEAVPGFWYLSCEFLEVLISQHRGKILRSRYFHYERPLSGWRRRSVLSFEISGGEPSGS